jgi:Ca2+-binding EF-hand superfamily protein
LHNRTYIDGNGRISWEELGYVMKILGHRVSEPHLKEIMKLIDENG